MIIEISSRGIYKVVKIFDSVRVLDDLTKLKTTIEQCLKKGHKYIAVNFNEASYLYSGAISVLISCYKMVKEHDGHLCIIEPQQRVLDLLIQMNIDSLVDIYKTEEELLEILA